MNNNEDIGTIFSTDFPSVKYNKIMIIDGNGHCTDLDAAQSVIDLVVGIVTDKIILHT